MIQFYLVNTKKLVVSILCFFSFFISFSQDIHFSQFFEAPLLRNPSLAGLYNGDIRVQAVYRDQWNSVTDAYKTTSVNAEYKMPFGKNTDYLTLGAQVLQDRAGTVSWVSTHLLPAINYHKSLSEVSNQYLSLGFMGGPVQRRLDRSKMTTNSSFDGLGDGENFTRTQYTYYDASVGMSFNSQVSENPNDNFFIGVAYQHFTHGKNSFFGDESLEITPKWVASGGIKFSVQPESYITLLTDISVQEKYKEVVMGGLYGVKIGSDYDNPLYTIHAGGFLRWNDAFIPVVKLDYNPFSISLSYDANISNLKSSSHGRGGFELGISYIGFTNRDNSTLNAVNCPKF